MTFHHIRKMMEPGFSKPWPDSLEFLTGTREMSATSLMKYFDPLYKWLQEANSLSRECLGWDSNTNFSFFLTDWDFS